VFYCAVYCVVMKVSLVYAPFPLTDKRACSVWCESISGRNHFVVEHEVRLKDACVYCTG
jgi:hypothetical protein